MTDFLLELRSEEIPARMQAKAREDLARLFAAELAKAGLTAREIVTYATPRRLALIARDLPEATAAVSEEVKGPRTSALPQALEGFLRKTGLTRDQLTERDGVFFAVTDKPGRATAAVLAEAIPAIIRAFPWPKSMRWGEASIATDSIRWVRPLHGIVALFGEELVPVEIAGVTSQYATLGHRFHHPGPITLGGAHDYVEKLRACHVVVDQAEREDLIRTRAAELAAEAGLELVADEGLVAENAGLTEWPVPLLGRFDAAYLDVPPEVIQLTARVNQKYFVCKNPPRDGEVAAASAADGGGSEESVDPATLPPASSLRDATSPSGTHESITFVGPASRGGLANAFICTANIDAADDGARIVEGNRKVLAARLSDARFFYEQDAEVRLEDHAAKLDRIVFHEKLGTVADKVDRVAKLARWLVEEGIVLPSPLQGRGSLSEAKGGEGQSAPPAETAPLPTSLRSATLSPEEEREELATLAERAARLCKADLVTGMVGEFPELQGIMGGYYARAQGEDPCVAAAIRDHYKPVGQGDEVPIAPVTVAVSLADKLDTILGFAAANLMPTGSSDPFAIRRAVIGFLRLIQLNDLRLSLTGALQPWYRALAVGQPVLPDGPVSTGLMKTVRVYDGLYATDTVVVDEPTVSRADWIDLAFVTFEPNVFSYGETMTTEELADGFIDIYRSPKEILERLGRFITDRLKVQQREAGVRHDLIDAVFALGGEDDLVRLLARVRALQAFVGTEDGANLLTGYRRAANILKKEGYLPSPSSGERVPDPGESRGKGGEGQSHERGDGPSPDLAFGSATLSPEEERERRLSYTPEPAESALYAALDFAEPAAADAVAAEDFGAAMAALASLRAPIDRFFDEVTVNDPDPAKRNARLALLARMRDAVHTVADFSRIEG